MKQNCTDSPPSAAADSGGATEEPVMLFGVRIGVVDSMRKSNSMNNLSDYEPVNNTTTAAAVVNLDIAAANELIKDGGGYASADDAVPASNVSRERKRGVPWTEEEHKQFLVGLKKVGKGDWRGISRNYVKTRTPTQVASHAQKHFLRQSNLTRRRRRSSLFDITTDSVAAMPIDEDRNDQENQAQQVPLPTTQSPPVSSNANGFSVVPFPVTFSPVMLSMQGGNILGSPARTYTDHTKNSFVGPIPVPVPVLPVPMDLNFNQQVLSLNLSLASGNDQSRTRDSSFQVMQGFNNGDSIITGAA